MIQIDMKMPKCCDDCDICYDGCYCPIARKPMNFETSGMQRMPDCPLHNVPETSAGKWISVKDRMPEEHPSIFSRFYGTEKWSNGMWRNESDRVLVTILFPDGTRTVDKGKLQDGAWKTGVSPVLPQEVTHWAVWPEAAEEP